MNVTVFVEVLPDGVDWEGLPRAVTIGKTWKRRPRATQLAGGAICVEVRIEVPRDRMMTIVRAVTPTPPPASVT